MFEMLQLYSKCVKFARFSGPGSLMSRTDTLAIESITVCLPRDESRTMLVKYLWVIKMISDDDNSLRIRMIRQHPYVYVQMTIELS
jgi:hypothetical protein